MKAKVKNTHIQIRLSKTQKALINKNARACGKDLSKWILDKILINKQLEFLEICKRLANTSKSKSFILADISDFLVKLSANEFTEIFSNRPDVTLSTVDWNILTAMIEHTAHTRKWPYPNWCNDIPPIDEPIFATELTSLKTYLLFNSPIAFRKRNIFVDATTGDRH